MSAKQYYEIKAQAESRHAEVRIYAVIGESWWEETISAKQFQRELDNLDVDTISLRINSPGGSVFDGHTIFNALQRHPATVTAYVDGLAGSIASVVALAAEKVVMAKNAIMMIHKPYGGVIGEASDMRKYADTLDKLEGLIIDAYQEKSGRPREEIAAAIAEETWFTAQEAVDFGLADAIGLVADEPDDTVDPSDDGVDAAMDQLVTSTIARFRNAPEQIAARYRERISPTDNSSSEATDTAPKEEVHRPVSLIPEGAEIDERTARLVDLLAM